MLKLVRYLAVVLLAGALTATSAVLVAPHVGAVLSAGEAAKADDLDLEPLSQRSVVLAADGSTIGVLHEDENRADVALKDVPQVVIDTVLTVEDREFYEHDGVNVRATLRALLTNVEAGDVRQGGSTITQQLVKNAFLTPEEGAPDRDLGRKLEEAILAQRLEDSMSKTEILERYLNTVYLGNTAYGIKAAAEVYFNVDVSRLGPAEAAFIAGLIRNPVGYDPFLHAKRSRERRDQVLDQMEEVDKLTAGQVGLLKGVPLPAARMDTRPKVNYFVEEVQRRLLDDPRLGETQPERYNALFRGGLTIKTTIDPLLQTKAEYAVATTLPDTGGVFTTSVVSVEPSTGAVRALVGGPGFETLEYNIATQGAGRQPGSSFKPFVLAAALDTGFISPRDTIRGSAPCEFDPEDYPVVGPETWEVDNYEGQSGGTLDLYGATRRSLNCAYARLVLIVGTDRAAEMASRLGITTEIGTNSAMALGSEEVYPLDMASAYGTFAAEGVRHVPYFVEEITNRKGEVILRGRDEGTRVLSEDVSRQVTDVLRGVVTGGTGTAAALGARPVAGKTGTSQNSADAWFVGYTPQLSTAVWMGSSKGRVPILNVGGVPKVTGGTWPARIWSAYMGPALDGKPVESFTPPPRLTARSKQLYIQTEIPDEPEPRPTARRRSRSTT
ncbi:MAG: transglycosylase domain-containing protein, partial [Actinomycetota bacterium]|nr:transglycosylase domain-containing protein [Actinomycetota bacterium]